MDKDQKPRALLNNVTRARQRPRALFNNVPRFEVVIRFNARLSLQWNSTFLGIVIAHAATPASFFIVTRLSLLSEGLEWSYFSCSLKGASEFSNNALTILFHETSGACYCYVRSLLSDGVNVCSLGTVARPVLVRSPKLSSSGPDW